MTRHHRTTVLRRRIARSDAELADAYAAIGDDGDLAAAALRDLDASLRRARRTTRQLRRQLHQLEEARP